MYEVKPHLNNKNTNVLKEITQQKI